MVATAHNGFGTLVGLAVISVGQGYGLNFATLFVLALVFGIIFHYITDLVPHGHFFPYNMGNHLFEVIGLDLFLSFFVILALAYLKFGISQNLILICAAVLGTQLPDVIGGLEQI